MKTLAIALLILASPARAEDWADSARPVYRELEALADSVYGLMRGHLISTALPGRLSRRMSAVPVDTSDRIFTERLRHHQEQASRRLLEDRPIGPMGPAEAASWRRSAVNAHASAVTDAFADALVCRYQLERFGSDSGAYASNLSNWDAEFMTSAAILGGAYLYVAGLRTDFNVGPLRVDFDTRPGSAAQNAIQSGDAHGLAALTLSRPGSPLSFKTEWGVKDGRMTSERVGVNYSTRF
ncbi:MAG TPA: hypothetical protein DCZ01_08950 [Elusimicrobia bacterium]|nr:MAG: hypothetical protein A2X37_02410 [Elusimicrobia bacterium GWA2_66_18]HAZ08630.1 hypothetical protein [Elusimicrobiota bacterium]